MSAAATDGWGRIDGTAHFYPVRVYYEDTDAGGIVYHANYLKFAERGRTEMLRLVGINHSEMATRYGLGFAVRSCSIEFRRAARLDDTLEVRSRLVELRGASIRVEQAILRGAEVIAELMLRIVCLQTHGERTHGDRAQGRAARIPDPVYEILQPYVETREQD